MRNFRMQIQVRPNGKKDAVWVNDKLCKLSIVNGIVSIENGSTGMGHSIYPNIHKSGSVKRMKDLGYWGKDDQTVRAGNFIYNTSKFFVTDELDFLAWLIQRRINGVKDEASIDPISMNIQELSRLKDKTIGLIGKVIDSTPVLVQTWTGFRKLN